MRPDRYFTLRFSHEGRQVEEALGWASEGWTLARAQEELGKLRAAQRTGEGAPSLRQRAAAQRRAEQQRAEAEAAHARRQKTVSELWQRYATEVVDIANRASTIRQKRRMWATRVEPAIGALKINDVTESDVGGVVRAPLRLDPRGQVAGGKGEAGNLYRLLHHLFAKALLWGLRSKELGNPLAGVLQPRVARRERLLNGAEIGALMAALDAAETEGTEPPQILGVIRAAIFTGARIGELLNLRHEDVRRDEMELHLRDTKTGFSRRPISQQTLAVLDSVPRRPGAAFVFCAIRDARKPLPYRVAQEAFQRIAAKAGVERCTLHSIRHWLATMTANSVANPRVGMALTGHKSHSAYMGYVHADAAQARALADQLAALTTGLAKATPNIAPLRRSKA